MKQAGFPAFTARSFMRQAIKRMARSQLFTPLYDDVPAKIDKEIVTDLDAEAAVYPLAPVVPFIKVTQDRVVLEIMRGCIRGCRFCQAGQLYRPLRERNVDELKEYASAMLKNTGHEEISLSSLSSSDYSKLPELIDYLIEECDRKKINISLPSCVSMLFRWML